MADFTDELEYDWRAGSPPGCNSPLSGPRIATELERLQENDQHLKDRLDAADPILDGAVLITGDQTIQGVKTFASVPLGLNTVNLTGDQDIAGLKTFSIAPAGTQFSRVAYITATLTWIVPAGVTRVFVRAWGPGGGGGAGSNSANIGGSGGGAGGYAERLISGLTPGAAIVATVGTPGNGATTNGTDGGTGTDTSFGVYLSASAGGGGAGSSSNPLGGTTGYGANGDLNLGLGDGYNAPASPTFSVYGGNGGGPGGGRGGIYITALNGRNGAAPGAGGGGGGGNASVGGDGGTGGPGLIVVHY